MDVALASSKAATGVPGLDAILSGGFTKGALFLVEGTPGTGKTTLALLKNRTQTWTFGTKALPDRRCSTFCRRDKPAFGRSSP